MSSLFKHKYTFAEMTAKPDEQKVVKKYRMVNVDESKRKLDNILFDEFTKEMTTSEYITKPFYHIIDDSEFKNTCGVEKIISVQTGGGKTYTTATKLIPYLLYRGVNIVVFVVPEITLFDETLFLKKLRTSPYLIKNDISPVVLMHNDVKDLEYHIEQGHEHFVLCMTRQMFANSKNENAIGAKLINLLINLKLNSELNVEYAIFSDEAHLAQTSHLANYKANTGNSTPVYKARLYTKLELLSYFSPYMFGLTATSSFEQIGKLEVVGNMDFRVINKERPNRYKMAYKSAWFGSHMTFSTKEKKDTTEMENRTYAFLRLYFKNVRKFPNHKQSMLIKAEQTNGWMPLVKSLKLFAKIIHEIAPELENKELFARIDDTGSYVYKLDSRGNLVAKQMESNKIFSKLNDIQDSLRFLFVVEKGGVGISVNTLKWLISYRRTYKKGADSDFVLHGPLQLVGRLVRVNAEDSNYDLDKYIDSLSEEEFEIFCEMNSYHLLTFDNEFWREAVSELHQLTVTREEAKMYFKFKRGCNS